LLALPMPPPVGAARTIVGRQKMAADDFDFKTVISSYFTAAIHLLLQSTK
jgi:hypothetical protein